MNNNWYINIFYLKYAVLNILVHLGREVGRGEGAGVVGKNQDKSVQTLSVTS